VTAKRIGAALVAVALIVVALVVRRVVIDDDDASAGPSTVATTAPPTAATELVCATELAAACRAVQDEFPQLVVRVQPAGTTLDGLVTFQDAAPLWATLQPFPAMVDELRTRDPIGYGTEPLAASQLTIATPGGGRADALTTGCGADPLWRCIGAHAGAPWTDLGGDPAFGRIRPSVGLVDREAVALASFANAVAGYVGSPQINPATLLDDPAFLGWLQSLSGVVNESDISAGTPLATMVTRAGTLDIAATTAAEVAAILASRPTELDLNYPQPLMWAEAVLAVPRGAAAPDGLAAALTEQLSSAGWGPARDATEKVPDATTMVALRKLWQDVAR